MNVELIMPCFWLLASCCVLACLVTIYLSPTENDDDYRNPAGG